MLRILLLLICLPSLCFADIIYMGPGETHTTLTSAFSAMSSGDTLIIRNGIYTGPDNTINASNYPPSGLDKNNPTVVQAETIGSVIFDGENNRQMFYFTGMSGGYPYLKYWKFSGISWIRSSEHAVELTNGNEDDRTTGDLTIDPSYIQFKNCFVHSETGIGFYLTHIRQILIEDCAGFGSGRYNINPYYCDQLVVRRFVGRLDAVYHDSFLPTANYVVYASHDISFQNCISIDTDSNNFNSTMDPYGGFYIRNSYVDRHAEDTDMLGCMIVNYDSSAADPYMTLYIQSDPINTAIENMVILGSSRGISVSSLSDDVTVNHVSILSAANQATGSSYQYGYVDQSQSGTNYLDVTNSCIAGCTFLTPTSYTSDTTGYNGAFENSSNTLPGSNNVTSNPEFVYPIRIESGSPYNGAASDEKDIGATIMYKYGADGSFYGDSGYATLTSVELWPWPNQVTIKTFFSQDFNTTDETRGFCAIGEDLTNYVIGWLGASEVADFEAFYGTSTKPVVSAGTDQEVSSSSATISGSYTIESGRTILSCTWSNDQGGSGTLTASGGTISGAVTGLTPSTDNTITITITDSEGESGSDTVVITYTPPESSGTGTSIGVVSYGAVKR